MQKFKYWLEKRISSDVFCYIFKCFKFPLITGTAKQKIKKYCGIFCLANILLNQVLPTSANFNNCFRNPWKESLLLQQSKLWPFWVTLESKKNFDISNCSEFWKLPWCSNLCLTVVSQTMVFLLDKCLWPLYIVKRYFRHNLSVSPSYT